MLKTASNATDTVAKDVWYYLRCWIKVQHDAATKRDKQSIDHFDQIVCNNEINLIRKRVFETSGIATGMNTRINARVWH